MHFARIFSLLAFSRDSPIPCTSRGRSDVVSRWPESREKSFSFLALESERVGQSGAGRAEDSCGSQALRGFCGSGNSSSPPPSLARTRWRQVEADPDRARLQLLRTSAALSGPGALPDLPPFEYLGIMQLIKSNDKLSTFFFSPVSSADPGRIYFQI